MDVDIAETLRAMTGGQGPDACIDAVGLEAHGWGSIGAVYDRAKMAAWLATDRLEALRHAIQDGRLAAGTRLPASRRLAEDLGVE